MKIRRHTRPCSKPPPCQSRPVSVETITSATPVLASARAHHRRRIPSDLSIINGDRPRPIPMVLQPRAWRRRWMAPVATDLPAATSALNLRAFLRTTARPAGAGRHCTNEAAAGASTLIVIPRWRNRAVRSLNHQVRVILPSTPSSARDSLVRYADRPPEVAAVFGCAVLTGSVPHSIGAGASWTDGRSGRSPGGVGLSAVLGALAAGAREVVAVDVLPRLELALALQVRTQAFRADDPDIVAQLRAAIPGGVDMRDRSGERRTGTGTGLAADAARWYDSRLQPAQPGHRLQLPVVQMTAEGAR